ncbi:hypothetical protein CDD81_1875 [Ophiocordyceps australis]|uniref:FAM50A/XAP5 C-terminal domain-containing protein n=1 Tax=Ophiocordyceps australis TaxID=1399860 RepID=A0A2C5XSP5_9HYPO|nr:hypothetical protein CDD81_1875 [Ophiocordyceps australis]
MADPSASRFAPQNKSTHERLSTNTVGLVALSDYRKRRAEVLEQQEREAREAALSATRVATPDSAHTPTPTPDGAGSESAADSESQLAQRKKKRQKLRSSKKLLSFAHGDDDDDDNDNDNGPHQSALTCENKDNKSKSPTHSTRTGPKFKPNALVAVMPKVVTKAALRKEAAEREALRREFLAIQEAVKASEIGIPFVFYDGVNTPGGTVRVKKGDFVWVFLDRSRKLAAQRAAGDQRGPRRSWARVGVDDLMLVRDTVIIPHHYDFYFFIINKSLGPSGRLLFDYSTQAPAKPNEATGLSNPAQPAVETDALEGASDNGIVTKVVDRRWYERNKHIYPASTWQEFDPEKNFAGQIAKDNGGNTFFFAR